MSEDFKDKYQLVKNKLNKAIEWINYLNKKQKNLEERIKVLEKNSPTGEESQFQENLIGNKTKNEKINRATTAQVLEKDNIITYEDNNDLGGENEKNVASKTEKTNSKQSFSLEEKIGSNWFAWLGILALIFGVGFFIKYSFEMNWINHLTRIVFGLVLGSGLIFTGEKIEKQKKYKNFGQTLIGGGLATIYFSIFAAYHFKPYRMAIGISQLTDILLLMFVVVGSVLISVRKNSKIIATEAFFLGYFTSLLAGRFDFLSLVYGALLTMGLVVVVFYKKWEVIGLAGMLASYFLFLPWADQNQSFTMGSLILITYFISFVFQFSLKYKSKQKESLNMFGFSLNAFIFFGLFFDQFKSYLNNNFSPNVLNRGSSLLVSNSQFNQILAVVPLAMAVFLLAIYSFFKSYYSKRYLDLLNYLSLAFITMAISIYFNSAVTTIFFLLEFIILLSGFIKTKTNLFKHSALVLGFISGLKLFAMDLELISWEGSNFQDPRRFVILIFGLIIFYLASYLLNKHKNLLKKGEEIYSKIFSITAFILVLVLIFTEIFPISSFLASLSLLLAFIILLVAFYFKKSNDYFFESNFVYLLLFFNLIENANMSVSNVNYLRFILLIVFVGLLSYLLAFFVKNKLFKSEFEDRKLTNFYNYIGGILLIFLISYQFSGALISLFWGLLALVILSFGFYFSDKDLRLQSFLIFALVIFKVFIIDVSELEIIYRIFSYLSLGLILLLVSFIYNKNKDRLKDLF